VFNDSPSESDRKYLVNEITTLQAQVGRDVFVDSPGKFVVQLPRHDTESYRTQRENAGYCNQERLHIMPKVEFDLIGCVQNLDRTIDLIVLDCSVYEQTEVVETKSDDLNRVLEA
jgi:hypothetical protein